MRHYACGQRVLATYVRCVTCAMQSLPDDVARTVACSIVGARLDYCNSLFVGILRHYPLL